MPGRYSPSLFHFLKKGKTDAIMRTLGVSSKAFRNVKACSVDGIEMSLLNAALQMTSRLNSLQSGMKSAVLVEEAVELVMIRCTSLTLISEMRVSFSLIACCENGWLIILRRAECIGLLLNRVAQRQWHSWNTIMICNRTENPQDYHDLEAWSPCRMSLPLWWHSDCRFFDIAENLQLTLLLGRCGLYAHISHAS